MSLLYQQLPPGPEPVLTVKEGSVGVAGHAPINKGVLRLIPSVLPSDQTNLLHLPSEQRMGMGENKKEGERKEPSTGMEWCLGCSCLETGSLLDNTCLIQFLKQLCSGRIGKGVG